MLNTKENLHTITEVTLAKHKMWSIEGDRRGDVVSCKSGTLWITQEGDLKDYILEACRDFWVTKPGTIVVQALDDSQFKYNLNELKSHIEINPQPIHHSPRSRLSHPLR
jgi:hypothetical protein